MSGIISELRELYRIRRQCEKLKDENQILKDLLTLSMSEKERLESELKILLAGETVRIPWIKENLKAIVSAS